MNAPLQTMGFAILLTLLLSIAQPQLLCSNNCTATTPNAYCTNQGYCSCQTNYIFNCNTNANYLMPGSILPHLIPGTTYYYILSAAIGSQLVYTTYFEDQNNEDILSIYLPNFFTDLGITTPPAITYTNTQVLPQPYRLTCSFRITLSNQVGTNIGSRLVLKLKVSNFTTTPALSFSYSYSQHKQKNESIFLIIGYVVGGLLVVTSVVFIVLIYRKKSRRPRRGQDQQIVQKCDISHFAYTMPPTLASPQHLKEASSCSVCLQQFDFNCNIRITICKHIFHVGCIDEWCVKNVSCPMCRTDLSLENITRLKAQQQRGIAQNEWIINSLHQQEPSQIRNPLFEHQERNNNQL